MSVKKTYALVAACRPYSLLSRAPFSNQFGILAQARVKSTRMCRGILGDAWHR